jgi:hypothetical protein
VIAALFSLWAACGGARPAPAATARAPAPATATLEPSIEERLEEVHDRSAPGRPPISDVRHDTLVLGATRDFALRLHPGWCYLVVAVGTGSVGDLDLFLYDPDGFKIGWDRGSDATPVVRACTSVEGTYRLRARMFEGSGDFALRVYGERMHRSDAPTEAPIEIPLRE